MSCVIAVGIALAITLTVFQLHEASLGDIAARSERLGWSTALVPVL